MLIKTNIVILRKTELMPKDISLSLMPRQAADTKTYVALAARLAGVAESQVALAQVLRRSIDARRGQIKVNLLVRLYIDDEQVPAPVDFRYDNVSNCPEVVIVGSGPSGLFCALRLIEVGYRPVILERGRDVSSRKRDIAVINRGGAVDPDSNYCFGEGGAGTFSDGKLFTRSKKRGDYNKALQVLVHHGATPEILYDARPHIGTDRLPRVVSNIRQTILAAGGSFVFGKRVTGLKIKDGCVKGVLCGSELVEGVAVVLATGHSARDIYDMLWLQGVRVEAKPFAMGVRIEHPQSLIDHIQYRQPRGEFLPAAAYTLAAQVGGRGVYSFCMCPGGFVVPAMTSDQECVVNGMSPSGRNSPYANSAIVTEIRLDDFGYLREEYGELAGLEFQRRYEYSALEHGGRGHAAPGQRVADFVAGRASKSVPETSYVPGLAVSDMHSWMPEIVSRSLMGGLEEFGRKMKGFVTNEACLIGVESRTSTPVRIPRDPVSLQHPEISGLYPAGEGAGYAGGIVSAALDGERIADAIAAALK